MARMARWWRDSLAEPVLSVLFPPRCVGCGDFETHLCASCRATLVEVGDDSCPRCGEPGPMPLVAGRCSHCMGIDLGHAGARSAFRHQEVARRLVAEFKFGGQPVLGRLMADLARPAFAGYASSIGSPRTGPGHLGPVASCRPAGTRLQPGGSACPGLGRGPPGLARGRSCPKDSGDQTPERAGKSRSAGQSARGVHLGRAGCQRAVLPLSSLVARGRRVHHRGHGAGGVLRARRGYRTTGARVHLLSGGGWWSRRARLKEVYGIFHGPPEGDEAPGDQGPRW